MTELEKRIAAAREKISGGEAVKTSGGELAERIAQAREKLGSTAPAAAPAAAPVAAPRVTVERNLIQARDDAGMLPGKTGSTASRINALREQDGKVDLTDRSEVLGVIPGKVLAGKAAAPAEPIAQQPVSREFSGGREAAGGGRSDAGALKQMGSMLREPIMPESWEDFGKGLAYNAERVAAGLLGAGENVTDFLGTGFYKALQGITSAGGLAPNAVSEWSGRAADKFLQNSVSRDYEQSIKERYNPSRSDEMASGIAQSVAQILLDVAAGKGLAKVVGAGAGLMDDAADALKASRLGKAAFGLRAAGGGANEAHSEGASAGQALAYGAASGATEVLIESIAGGIPGLGEGKLGQVVQKVTSNPVVNKALDILGEGGEEALSAIVSPFIKRALYDKDAELATVDEIAESAILGIVTSALLQGLELPGAVAKAAQSGKLNKGLPDDFFDISLTGVTGDVSKLGAGKNKTVSGVEAVQEYQRQEHHGNVLDAVRAHLAELVDVEPVKHLSGAEFQKSTEDNRNLRAKVLEFFNRLGNKVTRPGFGDIALNNSGVHDSLGHGYGKLKAATFAALPDVLREGKLIAHEDPYEGHDYDSYFIAAPVTVAGETCYVGALVIKDVNTQRYKLHEVLMADKNGTPSFKTEAPKTGSDIRDSAPFEKIVSQPIEEVKAEGDPLLDELDLSRLVETGQKAEQEFTEPPMFQRVTPLGDGQAKDGLIELPDLKAEDAARAEAEAREAQTAEAERSQLDKVKQLYKDQYAAKRNYERIRNKAELTEDESAAVDKLLRGDIDPEDLKPERYDVEKVMQVYEAKAAKKVFDDEIEAWNAARREALRAKARKLLKTSATWKDKAAGLLYSRETMERNVRDIVPDQKLAEEVNKEYFYQEKKDSANVNRTLTHYRDRVKKLNLSRKVKKGETMSESAAVQLLGEAEFNIQDIKNSRGRRTEKYGKTAQEWEAEIAEMWEKNPSLKAKEAKIRAAVAEFRKIYNELYQQMNDAHIRNGYKPVGYIEGYFPHFQADETDNLLAKLGMGVGINVDTAVLPTSINGLTHTFKPGKQWFAHAQQRTGFDTTYDALEGFERYIGVAANVIHRTDTIQRQRALAREIRYQGSDEATRQRIRDIEKSERTEDEKETAIKDATKGYRYALSNFVVELEEHTNLYAGKKSRYDRMSETDFGRRMYRIMGKVKQRTGANMVGANLASAATNFIPITTANAELGPEYIAKGMWGTMRSYKESDGLDDVSTFLINRRGGKPVYQTFFEKASDVASIPMEAVDLFTAGSLVRARYRYNMDHGISPADALDEADSWVGRVMADRSKGAMPTLFERRSPLWGMLTQFQLEMNNGFSHQFKDVPKDLKDKSIKQVAAYLFLLMVGRYIYNDVSEKLFGRRPAADPLGILNDTVGDFTGYEMPNLLELRSGFETEQQKPMKALGNLGTNVLEELPFTSALSMFGLELDGGRLPVTSAFPDLTNLSGGNWRKEMVKPLTYLVPPFGGGQAKKAIEGVTAVAKGGSYKKDAEGNDKLQYPVFSDSALETTGALGKAVFFGKSSLGTAQDWVESGFKTWDANYTKAYQTMREAGMGEREAYEILSAMKAEEKAADKLGYIAEQGLDDETSRLMAGLVMGTELETDEGQRTAYAKLLAAEEELGLTAAEYLAYYNQYGGQAVGQDKLREAYGMGVDPGEYLEFNAHKNEYDRDNSGSLSNVEKIDAIEKGGFEGDARTGMYLLTFPSWGETAEKHNVNVNVYIDFKIATRNAKTKDQTVQIINRMGVKPAVKDKLFLAAGYSEKTLKDTPWN